MSYCPRPIPTEPGCLVRRIGPSLQAHGRTLNTYVLVFWQEGRAWITREVGEEPPTLGQVMSHFGNPVLRSLWLPFPTGGTQQA